MHIYLKDFRYRVRTDESKKDGYIHYKEHSFTGLVEVQPDDCYHSFCNVVIDGHKVQVNDTEMTLIFDDYRTGALNSDYRGKYYIGIPEWKVRFDEAQKRCNNCFWWQAKTVKSRTETYDQELPGEKLPFSSSRVVYSYQYTRQCSHIVEHKTCENEDFIKSLNYDTVHPANKCNIKTFAEYVTYWTGWHVDEKSSTISGKVPHTTFSFEYNINTQAVAVWNAKKRCCFKYIENYDWDYFDNSLACLTDSRSIRLKLTNFFNYCTGKKMLTILEGFTKYQRDLDEGIKMAIEKGLYSEKLYY